MENVQRSPALADLLTILYRPRATMRRILDGGGDRWTVQVVLLAFVCASVNDTDVRQLDALLPDIKLLPVMAIIVVVLAVGAATWVLALFIVSWIAAPIGRMLGGTGMVADVRAALAWGIVPVIWSVIYRVPLAVLKSRFNVLPQDNTKEILLNFMAHGGCGLVVFAIGAQIILYLWCLFVAGCTLGEAQGFSTEKGFVNLAIALALPLLVIGVAVFTFRS